MGAGGWSGTSDAWLVFAAPFAAIVGAYAGHRLRLPAGPFTGAMVGVGLLLAFLGLPEIETPPLLNQMLQVLAGILVGLRISRDSLAAGARMFLPATVLAALFLIPQRFAEALVRSEVEGSRL